MFTWGAYSSAVISDLFIHGYTHNGFTCVDTAHIILHTDTEEQASKRHCIGTASELAHGSLAVPIASV